MALIKCPECGHEVSDKALSCPNCGYTFAAAKHTEKTSRKRKVVIITTITCLVILIGIGASFMLSNKHDNANDSEVVVEEATTTLAYDSPDWAFCDFKGKVKGAHYVRDYGEGHSYKAEYDRFFTRDGSLDLEKSGLSKYVITRNDEGYIIKITEPVSIYEEGKNYDIYTWKNGLIEVQDNYCGNGLGSGFKATKTYDKNSNLIKEDINKGDDEGYQAYRNNTVVYSNYKFDDQGNWVSRDVLHTWEELPWDENQWHKAIDKYTETRTIYYY